MINERNRKLGTEITEGKAYKYQNKFNNSDNNNYVQRINVDLRVSNYERKYRRFVKKLNVWTHQIQDANVFIDLAIEKSFDYKLRVICRDLEKGKELLVDTINSGKIKDKKLMEISLNVNDDIEMTLKRWNDIKNGKKPESFRSSFFKNRNNNRGFNKNNFNNSSGNNQNNKNGFDLLRFDDDFGVNNNNNINTRNNNFENNLFDVFSGNNNINNNMNQNNFNNNMSQNKDFFNNFGNNNNIQNNNQNFFGNNNLNNSSHLNMNYNQNMNNNLLNELNKLKNENIKLKEQINKLQEENNQLKLNLQLSQQTITNYNYQIQNLNMKLKDKEKELNDMNNNLINNNNIKKYVDFNKIIVINFMSGDSIINNIGINCLKTDTFCRS